MRSPETLGPETKAHMEMEQLRFYIMQSINQGDVDSLQNLLEKFDLAQIQNDELSMKKIFMALKVREKIESSRTFKSQQQLRHFDEINELIAKHLKAQFLS